MPCQALARRLGPVPSLTSDTAVSRRFGVLGRQLPFSLVTSTLLVILVAWQEPGDVLPPAAFVALGLVFVATVAAAPELAGSYYPSLPTLTAAGVTFLPGVLSTAATVKLMWALARTDGDPDATRRLMRRPIAGEIALIGRKPRSSRRSPVKY